MAPEHKPELEKATERQAAAQTAKALRQDFAKIKTPAEASAALEQVEHAVSSTQTERKPLGALEETARQIAESDRESQEVADRAITTAGQGKREVSAAQRGRSLLRRALLQRLQPLEAIDTILFAQVNNLPHPKWSDRLFSRLSWLFTGGHGWLIVLAILSIIDRRRALKSAREIMPAIWLATFLVEGPVKRFFRRRRPFISIVRAVVVGRKPGSYSFPSGHSAAAFSGALLLARKYPEYSGRFFLLAGLIGFSRVFLGAHYPGDVVSGGFTGAGLAMLFHRIVRKIIGWGKG